MPRGGRREGAGRKKGALTRRTQEITTKALAEGITPLEVMLKAMRDAWDSGDKKQAADHAKDAAPYIHPRLAAVEHSGDMGVTVTHEDRIKSLISDSGISIQFTNGHDLDEHDGANQLD